MRRFWLWDAIRSGANKAWGWAWFVKGRTWYWALRLLPVDFWSLRNSLNKSESRAFTYNCDDFLWMRHKVWGLYEISILRFQGRIIILTGQGLKWNDFWIWSQIWIRWKVFVATYSVTGLISDGIDDKKTYLCFDGGKNTVGKVFIKNEYLIMLIPMSLVRLVKAFLRYLKIRWRVLLEILNIILPALRDMKYGVTDRRRNAYFDWQEKS